MADRFSAAGGGGKPGADRTSAPGIAGGDWLTGLGDVRPGRDGSQSQGGGPKEGSGALLTSRIGCFSRLCSQL